jgi:pyruvate dehydrogenase E2 component (dihydrolipoamide acetyltransferase)
MAKELQVKVPDIGDYKDVPVIDVLVKAGDSVEKDTPLVTLESDKATLDVPAPEAGVVKSITLKAGDKVSMGDAVLVMEVGGSDEAAKPEAKPAEAAEPPKKAEAAKAEPVKAESAAPAKKAESAPAPKKAAPAAKAASIDVTIPDIGDYKDVPVIEVLVKDGDTVEKDATLFTLESDKATLDVPAPAAGVISGFKIKVGDKVSKGDPVGKIEAAAVAESTDETEPEAAPEAEKESPEKPAAADTKPDTKPESKPEAPAKPEAAAPAESAAASGDAIPHASPSIRKFARELGVDLLKVAGSGPKGRITHEDVQGFVKKALAAPVATASASMGGAGIPAIPAIDFSQFGSIESRPLARIRKLSAAHLHRSWLNVPHVTQTDEADITELEAFRKLQNEEAGKDGVKLTLLPFIMKAVVKAIDAYPEFASSLSPDGENLIHKHYRHIGFAADTPNGLVVPVIRDADRKGIAQLAAESAELAKKARDGKLKGDDMKGGIFSISSLGGIGGSHFTPIVNAPEVGILGVSKGVMKPVWDGKAFQPRLMVPLSLSYDHRVIDGAYAARFIVLLVKLLSDLRRLAL